MMKVGKVVLVVDSVEEAVKFYTEKLAFDLVGLESSKDGGRQTLVAAHLRKGKNFISFRIPNIEELAEFSFIKRCASRCVGIVIDMKRGLDKYYQRCQKKGLKILQELTQTPSGDKEFSLKDPFGVKLAFVEPTPKKVVQGKLDFFGIPLKKSDIPSKLSDQAKLIDQMVSQIRPFGISRRSGKKFAKIRLKEIIKGS